MKTLRIVLAILSTVAVVFGLLRAQNHVEAAHALIIGGAIIIASLVIASAITEAEK